MLHIGEITASKLRARTSGVASSISQYIQVTLGDFFTFSIKIYSFFTIVSSVSANSEVKSVRPASILLSAGSICTAMEGMFFSKSIVKYSIDFKIPRTYHPLPEVYRSLI